MWALKDPGRAGQRAVSGAGAASTQGTRNPGGSDAMEDGGKVCVRHHLGARQGESLSAVVNLVSKALLARILPPLVMKSLNLDRTVRWKNPWAEAKRGGLGYRSRDALRG